MTYSFINSTLRQRKMCTYKLSTVKYITNLPNPD